MPGSRLYVNSLVKFVFVYMRKGPALLSEISPSKVGNVPYRHTQKDWLSYYACVIDQALPEGPENSYVKAR